MLINITANPRSRFEKVEKIADKEYRLSFNVVPEKGKANQKIIEMMANYLDVPKSNISIRLGKTAKEKVIEICDFKN
jgi:hypothetical protein